MSLHEILKECAAKCLKDKKRRYVVSVEPKEKSHGYWHVRLTKPKGDYFLVNEKGEFFTVVKGEYYRLDF